MRLGGAAANLRLYYGPCIHLDFILAALFYLRSARRAFFSRTTNEDEMRSSTKEGRRSGARDACWLIKQPLVGFVAAVYSKSLRLLTPLLVK